MNNQINSFIQSEGCPKVIKTEKNSRHLDTEHSSLEEKLNSFLIFIHRDLHKKVDDSNVVIQKQNKATKENDEAQNSCVNSSNLTSFLSNLHKSLRTSTRPKDDQKIYDEQSNSASKTNEQGHQNSQKNTTPRSQELTSEHRPESCGSVNKFLDETDDDLDLDTQFLDVFELKPREIEKTTKNKTNETNFVKLENELICRFCKKEFPTQIQRQYHEKNMHPKSKVMCEKCGEIMNLRRLKTHKMKHMVVRKFQCEICSKSFKDNYALKRHVSDTHDVTTNCICDHCGKCLSCKKSLRKHMIQYHMSHLAMKCPECNKPFGDKARLTRHLLVHKRERGEFIEQIKKEECQICNMKFTTSTHLKQHMGKHNQTKEFQCRYCPSAFNFFSSRRNHEKNVHNNAKVKKRKSKAVITNQNTAVEATASTTTMTQVVMETETMNPVIITNDDVEQQQQHQQTSQLDQVQQIIQPIQGITIIPQNILIATPDGTGFYAIAPFFCT